MRVDIVDLKDKLFREQIKPVRKYRENFLSEEDIKELRAEAKKIREAYIRSWRRAREVYVK